MGHRKHRCDLQSLVGCLFLNWGRPPSVHFHTDLGGTLTVENTLRVKKTLVCFTVGGLSNSNVFSVGYEL